MSEFNGFIINDKDAHITFLNQTLAERDAEIRRLRDGQAGLVAKYQALEVESDRLKALCRAKQIDLRGTR